MRMQAPEILLDLVLRQMDRRCDDVARRLMPDLHKIFAEIGFHHFNAAGRL